MKENNKKKIINCDEVSILTKAPPKDTAALDNRRVLAKVNSQGSGKYKPSPGQVPKVGEDNEWKDAQKKDTNKRASEARNRKNTRNKTINRISYFLTNSLNKSLNQ
jgi:hypothetical protein